MAKPLKTVAILVPPNAQSLDISGPMDAFLEANRLVADDEQYEVRLISVEKRRTITVGGMKIVADGSISDPDFKVDTLLVAGTPDYNKAKEMRPFLDWLKRRTSGVRRYGSVCTGTFFLGAAGLIDGRQVTTHWEQADELAEQFPEAEVMPDSIYIQDGSLYTSAGITAGIDLALKLIEDDHGRDISLRVARKLVVFLRRPGGQSQFSTHLEAQIANEDRVQALQHWILDHVDADLTLKALGDRVGMSVRNLSRVFLKETGETPADFVEKARVEAARRLLEENDIPLQRVATRSGFSNPDVMRRAFVRRMNTNPNDYRKRFRHADDN